MRFYGRQQEIKALRAIRKRSQSAAQFTLVTGRRRVGKTMLLTEAYKDKPYLYFFVSRKSEPLLCSEFQREAQAKLGIAAFGQASRFKDLLEQVLIHSQRHPLTLVIDEFQDFKRVNEAVFSEMQELWDKYKGSARINLVVCGSIYSLLVKLFEDECEPLFGRLSAHIRVAPFPVATVKQVLADQREGYGSDDLLCLYMLSGGVPKFIALLADAEAANKDAMLDYAASLGSPFLSEGKDILVSEFGRDYATYFSVLELVAGNKTSLSEIDSVLGTSSAPYLANLEKDYSLVQRLRPMFAKPGSRNNRWRIPDAYLRFYFRFIHSNQALVEQQRFDLLRESIQSDYSGFSGLTLEDYFRDKAAQEGRYNQVGASWDRKGLNQIDLIAISDLDKHALVAEVKRDAGRIDLSVLKAKAASLSKELSRYNVEYVGLSLADM